MRSAILLAVVLASPPAAGGDRPPRPRVIEAAAGETVSLDAPRPGGRWVELSGPDVLFRGGVARGGHIEFRVPTPGRYRLAHLPDGAPAAGDPFVVTVEVTGPGFGGAIVGPGTAAAGEVVSLAGGGGTGCTCKPPKGTERWAWRQLHGPRLRLSRRDLRASELKFRPESPGVYVFALRYSCGHAWSPWAVHAVMVPARADGSPERRPVAAVAPVSRAYVGEELLLDGSRSRDPDGDELSYRWYRVEGPEVALEGGGPRVPFVPPSRGDYSFTLTVVDPAGLASPPDVVTFTAVPRPGPARPDPDAADPLDRPFSVRLEDRPLSELVSRLAAAGVTVRASTELTGDPPFDEVKVDLWAVDVPVRKVLDWAGRALGAFYVVEGPGVVWFSRDTKWLEREEPVAETYRIDALWSEPDASGLGSLLSESVRAALWAGSGGGLGRPDPAAETVSAILPRSAQQRLGRLLAELRREVPSGPPPPLVDAGLALATRRPVRARYDDWPVRDIAWDLARQARMPVGFPALGPEGGGRVTLALGETTLDRALDRLCEVSGLAGWRAEPPGAVWLFKDSPPPVTSECTWSAAEVRSYDTRMLESAHGFAGPMLVHLVKGRCLPERWEDPYSLVGYSAARRRLVVIHVREVQLAVAALLDRLSREGQDALGE